MAEPEITIGKWGDFVEEAEEGNDTEETSTDDEDEDDEDHVPGSDGDSDLDSEDIDKLANDLYEDYAVTAAAHKGTTFVANNGYQGYKPGKSGGSGGKAREKPPAKLKGRDLGMWYKERSLREKAEAKGDKFSKKERKNLKSDKKAAERKIDPEKIPLVYFNEKNSTELDEVLREFERGEVVKKAITANPVKSSSSLPLKEQDIITETQGWNEDEAYAFWEIADPAMPGVQRVNVRTSLAENKRLDEQSGVFLEEFNAKKSDPNYQEMQRLRKKLPSYNVRQTLLKSIRENQVCVLSGETGCGKTTQVPQFILDEFMENGQGARCHIICTQPRRISAISVSERIARERAEKLGISVGYQIRLEKVLPRDEGSMLFCTTGILLQWLNSNKYLTGVSHIIVDEIHEQDILSDFLLIILKDILEKRKDLKVILMSATINAEKFSQYFGGCPLLNIPGFTYAVKEYYLEDIIPMLRYRPEDGSVRRKTLQQQKDPEWMRFLTNPAMDRHTRDILENYDDSSIDFDLVLLLIQHIVKTTDRGEAILVFLPGWDDIKKLHEILQKCLTPSRNFLIIPLHSMMPTINQRAVFERPERERKIVVATSIAETSITIDDIVHVIDLGKIKMKDYDVKRNLSTLTAQWVSVSNARQRKGRAGRVKSGVCYHMYTSYQYAQFAPYPTPEIQRTRLDELCLQLKMLKLGKVLPFVSKAMEPPEPAAVDQAVDLLRLIGAFDEHEELTALGELLAKTPIPPQLGKMLYLGCIFKCIEPILDICAVLSFRDPFCTPLGQEQASRESKNQFGVGTQSDHIAFHEAIKAFVENTSGKRFQEVRDYCFDRFLFMSTVQQLIKMKKQFAYILYQAKFLETPDPSDKNGNIHKGDHEIIRAIVYAGLYPNVGMMKAPKSKHQAPPIKSRLEDKMCVHPKSIFGRGCQDSGIVAFFSQVQTSQIFAHDITLLKSYNSPVLLFSKHLKWDKRKTHDVVLVDHWLDVRLKGTSVTLPKIERLRAAMNEILEECYKNGTNSEYCQRVAVQKMLDFLARVFKFKTTL